MVVNNGVFIKTVVVSNTSERKMTLDAPVKSRLLEEAKKSSSKRRKEIVTRRFGLTPLVRCPKCQSFCEERKKTANAIKSFYCPNCRIEQLAPIRNSLPASLFVKFGRVVNQMIKVGVTYEPEVFEKETLKAVKYFYDRASKDQRVKPLLDELGLHNRLNRCAAQYAYYSTREYFNRGSIIGLLAKYLEETIRTVEDFEEFTSKDYPCKEVVREAQRLIMQKYPKNGYLPVEFVRNFFRHVRNLVFKKLASKIDCQEFVFVEELTFPKDEEGQKLIKWLRAEVEKLLKSFIAGYSRKLTRRVNKIIADEGPKWKKGYFDPVIEDIIGETKIEDLNVKSWQKYRKLWREKAVNRLSTETVDFDDLVTSTIKETLTQITPYRLFRLAFQKSACCEQNYRFKFSNDILANWQSYLRRQVERRFSKQLVKIILPSLLPTVRKYCGVIGDDPWPELKRPVYVSQSIPFGIDDQALKLSVGTIPSSKKQDKIIETKDGVFVRFAFASRDKGSFPTGRSPIIFRLNTPGRFHEMVKRGYASKRPVLTKTKGGGALVLAIPFEKVLPQVTLTNSSTEEVKVEGGEEIVVGVDLGLKTLATVSVIQKPKGKVTMLSEGVREIARYFVDQQYLNVPLKNLFHREQFKEDDKLNVKRRLTKLQKRVRELKSQLNCYQNRHRKNYQRKVKYFRLRREEQRTWQKIRNLHEEIARQVATRIVTIAELHEAKVVKFEDLRWARHGKKQEIGYWLTTWQVHWFYSEIIRRTTEMARRKGLTVKLVDPRYTSKRCSSCGKHGRRVGLNFYCTNCKSTGNRSSPRVLHSDLNAARNIALASSSSPTNGLGGGLPLQPIVKFDYLVKEVQDCPILK